MTHPKKSGANLGESGTGVISIVSRLKLTLSAESAAGLLALILMRLNKKAETNKAISLESC